MIQLNWYQIFGQSIPDGRTVTPTDDIQIWLHCGNIWDKNYTTLAQVLVDTDTLVALMASDNAVDYLVRSTSWAGIGLVPTLASDNGKILIPAGQGQYTGEEAYKAFDGDDSTFSSANSALKTAYIGYDFDNATIVGLIRIMPANASEVTYVVQYSDDNLTWNDGAESVVSSSTSVVWIDVNDGTHRYWRIKRTFTGVAQYALLKELQFYIGDITRSEIAMKSIGASDYASTTLLSDSTWCDAIYGSSYFDYVANVAVPKMTSDTAPSGTCIQSGVASGYYAYQAFDRDDTTFFRTNAAISGAYVGYTFPASHKISKCKMLVSKNTTADVTYTYKVQGSNDGFSSDIHDLTSAFNVILVGVDSVWLDKNLDNTDAYKSFRLYSTTTLEAGVRMVIPTMQIFDREPGGVQTWLHAAGITNKNYTTLSEVLADTSTLSTLINNHSACDYLVTCKGWATTICADSNAMTYIGQNNYCANKLLADATWCNAIWNSTYKSSVINVYVPIMTGYTTPSGEVIESGHRTDLPDTAGWYAFGNQPSSRGWFSQNSGSTDTYLGYVFDDDIRLVAVVVSPHTSPNTNSILRDTGYIQGSNDSFVTSDTLDTIATGSYTDLTVVTPNNKKFRSIRIFASRGSGTNNTVIRQLQFYGRKDV